MRASLLVIFFLIGGIVYSQDINFSKDKDSLKIELLQFISNNKSLDTSKIDISKDYKEFLDAYFFLEKKEVSEFSLLLNNLKLNYTKDRESILHLIQSIYFFKQAGIDTSNKRFKWFNLMRQELSEIKSAFVYKEFIEKNYQALAYNTILTPSNIKWKWDASKAVFDETKAYISYNVTSPKLSGENKALVIQFNDVNFNFIPSKDEINFRDAKIFWDSWPSDSLFVDLGEFKMNSSFHKLELESTVLTNLYFNHKTINGKLNIEWQVPGRIANIYPVFKSWNDDIHISNIYKGVDFKGGIKVFGNGFEGVGNPTFIFKNQNGRIVRLNGNIFEFGKKGFQSDDAEVSFYLGETDSIFHPVIALKYDDNSRKLSIRKNSKRISSSPFYNTYSDLDLYLKDAVFDFDKSKLSFRAETFDRYPFISGRYYEDGILDRFKGLNVENPIYTINYLQDFGMEEYSIEFASNYLDLDASYVSSIISELSKLGLVYYDHKNESFKFLKKFNHAIDASLGKSDFDVISFRGYDIDTVKKYTANLKNFNIENYRLKGEVDLNDYSTNLANVEVAIVTADKNVYIIPEGNIKVKDDLNFEFDGRTESKYYKFVGKDFKFNYKDYKIELSGNQRMDFFVESFDKYTLGIPEYSRIKNDIDSLKGEILINYQENKNSRYDFPEYSKIKIDEYSYVYYDSPYIKDSIYSRDKLYVRIEPFEIDSLNSKNSIDLIYPGTVFAKGIFPPFEQEVTVQDDYYLGFKHKTDSTGIALYDKGIFKNTITLDGKGLNGKGKVEYLTSNFLSYDINFYPDSLRAYTFSYEINKIKDSTLDLPHIKNDFVDLLWLPKKDSVFLNPVKKNFEMYEGEIKKAGKLIFANNQLMGGGEVSFETAVLSSDNFNFFSDSFTSDSLEFSLRYSEKTPIVFVIHNGKGRVDLLNRVGDFELRDKNSLIYFLQNQYISNVDLVNWDIDGQRIYLSGSSEEKTYHFTSVNPYQDSLKFIANKAEYNLFSKEIDIFGVNKLFVADSEVLPDSSKVAIMEDGFLKSFTNASLKLGVGKFEHNLSNANLTVRSKNDISGDARYYYKDEDGVISELFMDNIYVDRKNKIVRAKGDIYEEDNFMLNAYFNYKGEIEVSGESEMRKFNGLVNVVNYCDLVESGEFPISGYINSEDIKLEFNNYLDSPDYRYLFSGIYYNDKSVSFNSALFRNDFNAFKYSLISADSTLVYNKKNMSYEIGGQLKNGIIQDKVSFFNNECRIEAKGEVKFHDEAQTFDLESYGYINYDLNEDELAGNISMAFDFFFNSQILDLISANFQNSRPFSDGKLDQDLIAYARSRYTNVPFADKRLDLFEQDRSEKHYNFPLFIENIRLNWDASNSAFVSNDEIYVRTINNVQINKFFRGKVEVKKVGKKNDISVLLTDGDDKYFFFRFNGSVIEFATNQRAIMEEFDKLEDKDREGQFKTKDVILRKAPKGRVSSFMDKYL